MARPKGSKNGPHVPSRKGFRAGIPKAAASLICRKCNEAYTGHGLYCSDRCGLLANVQIDDVGCWLFTGYKPKTGCRAGYGEFDLKSGKRMLAHRAAYLLLKGEEPGALVVMHKCDVPACINPQHLLLGTRTENNADRNTKNRQARGERHFSAKLTEDQVRAIRTDPIGCRRAARAYGVAVHTILSIRKRKTWKHI